MKVRIYQLARDLRISSDALVNMITALGVEVKSHMSSIDAATVERVQKKFDKEKEAVKEDFARKVEPFYKGLAEKYKDEPALLAWSITEENHPVQWFYEAIRDVTLKMAEWDPKHPVITLDNRAATAWLNAAWDTM